MRPMWMSCFNPTEELTNEDLLELEKDLNEKGDESSVVEPVKLLSTKQTAEFLSTLTLPLVSLMRMILTGREARKLLEIFKALWLVTNNSTGREKMLPHFFNIVENRQFTDPGPSKARKNDDPDSPVSFDSSSD
jgi:hypothetical protein